MAYLEKKHTQLEQALGKWGAVYKEPYSDIVRDATIQRYEFTFELLWKTVKVYLKEKEGIECSSPKACFREARTIFSISEEDLESLLQMADDRNLSVHTYSEKMAEELYQKTEAYFELAKKLSKKMD
jgi:nucleotidyltransferase substrate binding protein (TIGR01987 family)